MIISRVMINYIKKTNDFEIFSIIKILELLLKLIDLSKFFLMPFFSRVNDLREGNLNILQFFSFIYTRGPP